MKYRGPVGFNQLLVGPQQVRAGLWGLPHQVHSQVPQDQGQEAPVGWLNWPQGGHRSRCPCGQEGAGCWLRVPDAPIPHGSLIPASDSTSCQRSPWEVVVTVPRAGLLSAMTPRLDRTPGSRLLWPVIVAMWAVTPDGALSVLASENTESLGFVQ